MPLQIVRNDITKMSVDVIVNTANPNETIGDGVDSRIHKIASPSLLKARKKIGTIACGDAKITPAYGLNADYVIHTVGPVWMDGNQGEVIALASCYRRSLELAAAYKCESIAFPLISTENYCIPKDVALETAIREIGRFLLKNDMVVFLVVYDKTSYQLSEKLFNDVKAYIDDRYIEQHYMRATSSYRRREDNCVGQIKNAAIRIPEFFKEKRASDSDMPDELVLPSASKSSRKLEDMLREIDLTFTEALLEWIRKKDLIEPEVYKKANMDRKLFSKIRNNVDYRPSKITAIALAIGLELNLDETKDFIGRAGYALSHSSRFDIIIEYFILNENYNIFEINEVLFAFDEPIIGG